MAKDPKAGTTDQRPKWVGPSEIRPRGYVPGDENVAEDTKTSEDEGFNTQAPRNQRSTYRPQIDADVASANSDCPNELANPSPRELRRSTRSDK